MLLLTQCQTEYLFYEIEQQAKAIAFFVGKFECFFFIKVKKMHPSAFSKIISFDNKKLNFKNCLYSTSFGLTYSKKNLLLIYIMHFKGLWAHKQQQQQHIRYKDIGFGRCNKSLRGSPMFRQIFSIKKTPFHFFFSSFLTIP